MSEIKTQAVEVKLNETLLAGLDVDARWNDGPFLGLKLLPAKAKGKRFEQIAEAVLKSRGHSVQRANSTNYDRIVDGTKVEIKGSTISKGTDASFSFLQVRPAQVYDELMLECFYFDGRIEYYRIPKAEVHKLVERKIFKCQHGGNAGDSGTYCYTGPVTTFKDYFSFAVVVKK